MPRIDLEVYSNGIWNYKARAELPRCEIFVCPHHLNSSWHDSNSSSATRSTTQPQSSSSSSLLSSFWCVFFSTIWHFGQFLLISEHFLYILRSIVHADFWLLLFGIIFSASLPEISIFKTLTLVLRTIQHKPLTETLRFLSAFSFEFYEFRLQKFFSPFVVLLSIEAKKTLVAFLVVFWQTGNRNKILLRCG